MLVIIYSALISYMVFFSLCIAPPINIVLDRKNSSILLRKIFPRNFWFGIYLSFLSAIISFYQENSLSMFLSIFILISFLTNLYVLMPAINVEADLLKKAKSYSKKFKILHLISVTLYLINIIISTISLFLIV